MMRIPAPGGLLRQPWLLALTFALIWMGPPTRAADDTLLFYPLPGGVADAKGEVGYVIDRGVAFHAINLSNGREIWAAAPASLPLALAGDRVITVAVDPKNGNQFRLFAYSTTMGKQIWRSEPVAFPEWVAVTPDAKHWFGMFARVKDGEVWVKWRALAWKAPVAMPRAEKDAIKKAEGAIRVNLKTGATEMLAADKMPPPPPPAIAVSKDLEKLAARPIPGALGEKTVMEAGNFAVAIDVEKKDKGQVVVLQRWDLKTDKAQPPMELASGRRFHVTPVPAAGVVLVRPAVGPNEAFRPGFWQVFSLEKGKETAHFPVEPLIMEDATIVGQRAYYTMGGPLTGDAHGKGPVRVRMLKAVDLKPVRVAWLAEVDGYNSYIEGSTPPGDDP
jgi:hypothetical protein